MGLPGRRTHACFILLILLSSARLLSSVAAPAHMGRGAWSCKLHLQRIISREQGEGADVALRRQWLQTLVQSFLGLILFYVLFSEVQFLSSSDLLCCLLKVLLRNSQSYHYLSVSLGFIHLHFTARWLVQRQLRTLLLLYFWPMGSPALFKIHCSKKSLK